MAPQGSKAKRQIKRKRTLSAEKELNLRATVMTRSKSETSFCSSKNMENSNDSKVESQVEIPDKDTMNSLPVLQKDQFEGSDVSDDSCALCQQKFTDKHEFTLHLKTHHDQKETTCKICSKNVCSTSSLDRHLLIHSGERPHNCLYCPMSFTTNGNMNRHMFNAHPEEKKRMKEEVTNAKKSNFSKSPPKSPPRAPTPEQKTASEPTDFNNSPPAAKKPKKPKSVAEDPKPRKRSGKRAQVEGCKEQSKRIYSKNKDTGTPPPLLFQVPFSSRVFPIRAEEQKDMLRDTRPYKCRACPKTFMFLCNLRNHLKLFHKEPLVSNADRFGCPYCRTTYKSWFEFALHQMTDKCGRKPEVDDSPKSKFMGHFNLYKCTPSAERRVENFPNEEIKREETTQSSMKEVEGPSQSMEVDHSDSERLKSTENCHDFADIQAIYLNVSQSQERSGLECLPQPHLVRGIPGSCESGRPLKKKYYCPQAGCGYKSPDKSCVTRHMITHTKERPYICKICEVKFTTKSNGERHAKKGHQLTKSKMTDVIVYNDLSRPEDRRQCRYCRETFASEKVVSTHLRSNKSCDQKPFICMQCDEGFATRNNFHRHFNKQHRNVKMSEEEFEKWKAQNCLDRRNKMKPAAKGENQEDDTKILDVSSDDAPKEDTTEFEQQSNGDDLSKASKSSSSNEEQQAGAQCGASDVDEPTGFNSTPDMDFQALSTSNTLEGEMANNSETSSTEEPLDLSLHALDLRSHLSGRAVRGSLERDVPASSASSFTNFPLAPFPARGFPRGPAFTPLFYPLSPLASPLDLSRRRSAERVPCEHCDKTFSLPGNKNRHVKQMHKTDLVMPTRVLQNTDSNKPAEADAYPNKKPIKPEEGHHSDSENVDLASVRSVINTANSPCFNQYLTDGMSCDPPASANGEKEAFHPKGKSKENKYTCTKCFRSFQWGSGLKRHSVKHTGQKPYVCDKCDSKCSTKSNLTRHIKTIHRKNSDSASVELNSQCGSNDSRTDSQDSDADVCKNKN